MNRNLLLTFFITSFVLTLIGAFLKIVHATVAEEFLWLGLLSSFALTVCFVIEAVKSKYLSPSERFMWIVSFLFFGWFAAAIYLIKFRRVLSLS